MEEEERAGDVCEGGEVSALHTEESHGQRYVEGKRSDRCAVSERGEAS